MRSRPRRLALAALLLLLASSPACAVEQLHFVTRWGGNIPEHLYWDGAQLQGWNVIAGKTIVSPPALVSHGGLVHLFAVASDQKLYQATWNGTGWSGWVDFGGPFDTAGPAATNFFGFLILIATTPDHRLHLAFFDQGTGLWNGFFHIASDVFGRPALATHNGQLHFLVMGGDDHYYHQIYDGQFRGFVDIGGPFAFGPAIASLPGQLHLLGPGFNGHLFHGFFTGTQWQGFFDLGTPVGTQIEGSAAATTLGGSVLVALARGANNGLYLRFRNGGAWSAYFGSLGQTLTGPGATTHETQGGGGGGNRPPTLGSVVATRLSHSFGRDDALRAEGLGGRPGVDALAPLLAPAIVALDANVDGALNALDPIIAAAANLASCCTLLVAEGASDPDGNPVVFQWQATTGTFYSTGIEGSGGVPFGGKITDITTYTRNSVFWEAPSIGFPILFWDLMGGATNVGVKVTDVPSSGSPLSSAVQFAAVEWGRGPHLEVGVESSRRLPGDDPHHPSGFEISYLVNVVGNFAVGQPVTVRLDCGGRDLLVVEQILIPGVPVKCAYHADEEDHQVTATAVATVGGAFISAATGPGLDRWKSRGCTVGTTETTLVKGPGVCNDQQVPGGDTPDSRFIDLGRTSATFQFDFQTFSLEDRIIVRYQGQVLLDTGCVGDSGSQSLSYSGTSTGVTVQVIPNCAGGSGTAWNYTVHCPAP